MGETAWELVSERLQQVLENRGRDTEELGEVDALVARGRLDMCGVPAVIDENGIDGDSAARLVRTWLALSSDELVSEDSEAMVVTSRLARHGSYPASRLIARPALALWLSQSRWRFDPMPVGEMCRELAAYLDAARVEGKGLGGDEIAALLRQFRHRQLLRIFLREIEGASVRQTTAEVADLAAVCLDQALEEAARLQGVEELAEEICIMGMGKLGGRELNFSSDVDLVFVVSDNTSGEASTEVIEKLVRSVVSLIDEVTEQGRVFRVDLRLRPEGSRGRLVPSMSALVDYLLNFGRTWERGAWLKARPVAGDKESGWTVLEKLEPFLYRRHLDFDALDELRRMKQLIDEEAKAADFVREQGRTEIPKQRSTSPFKSRLLKKFKTQPVASSKRAPDRESGRRPGVDRSETSSTKEGPAGWDIKIGRGGIREIEFFVQALQLVHCGLRPDLRVRTTLDALDRLLYSGLLSAAEHAQLADAYDLFRRLEHRVQMEADRQSHRLPVDDQKFADLAGRMATDVEELRDSIAVSRRQVRSIFDRLFSQSPRRPERATVGEDRPGTLEKIIGLNSERLLDESVIERLQEAGFSRPRQVAGQLQVLRRKEHGPFSESPTSTDPDVARYLLGAVRDAPDPEGALGQLVRFSTAVGDTPSTWAMLSENPHAARLLIHLFGSSPPIGGLLAGEPDVFERLIYEGSAQMVRRFGEMKTDLAQRLSGIGDRARRMGRIRRFHREEVVRIALHEVAGAVAVEKTCRQLADLAGVVLQALFREVVEEYGASHVLPGSQDVQDLGLSVVAMGKLGGREMGFGSDLDFIFIYDAGNEEGLEHETATRLAKRLVRAMSAATAIGGLYEIDLRLRPSGSQGTLVISLEAWERYHRHSAALWERQALVRARTLTGSSSLRQRIEEQRIALAFERPVDDSHRDEIAAMRARLGNQTRGGQDRFDIKFDHGGLVDVEFITQWLQLASKTESVRKRRSTFEALRALATTPTRPISGVELESLHRDYGWLRRLECRLNISGVGPVIPAQGAALRALVRQMGHQGRGGVEQFESELRALRARVDDAWTAVFGSR